MTDRHRYYRVPWLLLAVACGQDAVPPDVPIVPPVPVATTAAVLSGDNQHADPADLLEEPVVFTVLDGAGHPMPNVPVNFSTPVGGGSVPQSSATTDVDGVVETPWTMGDLGGVQSLQLLVGDKVLATATASTCDPSDCFPPTSLSGGLGAANLLTVATYDASGQAVHPDIVRGHGAATGFWLALTPYPNGNSTYENPSIFRSKNATDWSVPKGVANPLAQPPVGGYLSDPDLVIDADQSLWMYYREVVGNTNVISVMRSTDGTQWSSPNNVIAVPAHELVSPAVVRRGMGAAWQMWSVNSGPEGCSAPVTTVERRTSSDGITWSEPAAVNLTQPGQNIWHIDVQWVPARAEYWAIYNTFAVGSNCSTDALWIARSADGVSWTTYPSPIARAGVISAFSQIVYRASFLMNPRATEVSLWMSGASYANNVYSWNTAKATVMVADLLAIAATPSANVARPRSSLHLPPPERDVGPGAT